MGDQNFGVRISADIAQFKKAMSDAAGSAKAFANKSDAELKKTGKRMQEVGGNLTRNVTLPIVGMGAAAGKMFIDFDSSMTKIQALVGLSADEVDSMRGSVLELSGDTARSPQELADALFVVTSAGLRGQEAMDTLAMAAKASAAGMGETETIARAVAGAVNAYGPEVLGAADATDILVATARAGNFETSELAGALGRVLPFANQAGAGLSDVGGAVALLTRTNGNAAESITQINGLMRAFVAPTAEAKKILGGLGIEASDVRDHIGENGLVSALEMLDGQLGGNREELAKLIGSSEGASAAFQILDADAKTLEDTFGLTANAAGITDEAFNIAAQSGGFKMQKAWAEIQATLIEVGAVVAPIAAEVAGAIADIVGVFSDLPGPVKTVALAFLAVAAAAGPVLKVGGKVVENFNGIKKAAAAAGPGMTGFAAVAGVAAVAYGIHMSKMASANAEFQEQLVELGSVADDQIGDRFVMAMIQGSFAGQNLEERLAELAATSPEAARRLLDLEETSGTLTNSFLANGSSGEIATDVIEGLRDAVAEEDRAAAQAASTMENYSETREDATEVTRTGRDAVDQHRAAVLSDVNAVDRYTASHEAAKEAHDALVESVLTSLSTMFDYESAVLNTDAAYDDFKVTLAEANAVMDDSEASAELKEQTLRELRLEEIRMAEQAYETAAALAEESGAMEGSSAQSQIMIDSLIEQAGKYPALRDEIRQYIAKLAEIPGAVPTHIKAMIDQGSLAQAERELEYLRRQRNATITVMTVGGVRQADHRAGIPGDSAPRPASRTAAAPMRDERVLTPIGSALRPTSAATPAQQTQGDTYNTHLHNYDQPLEPDALATAISMSRLKK